MRNVVVLPAPLGPSSPKISPRRTSNEVLATAVKSPKRRTSSRTAMTTSPDPAPCGRLDLGAAGGGAWLVPLALAQQHHERVFELLAIAAL